jgi:predicted xylose isomerase-like sugar epimerase
LIYTLHSIRSDTNRFNFLSTDNQGFYGVLSFSPWAINVFMWNKNQIKIEGHIQILNLYKDEFSLF